MSTIKTTYLQHPSASSPNLTLAADGSVSLDTGVWTNFTPTWTNLSVGNAFNAASYTKIGRTVHAYYNFGFGATTSVSGIFHPSLPVPMAGIAAGVGWAYDASTVTWDNFVFTPGAYFIGSGGSRYNATVPWSWVSGDIIRFSLTYQSAS